MTEATRRRWRIFKWRCGAICPLLAGSAFLFLQANSLTAQSTLPSDFPIDLYRFGGTFGGFAVGVWAVIQIAKTMKHWTPERRHDALADDQREAVREVAKELREVADLLRDRLNEINNEVRRLGDEIRRQH